jgi:hypothetical protein
MSKYKDHTNDTISYYIGYILKGLGFMSLCLEAMFWGAIFETIIPISGTLITTLSPFWILPCPLPKEDWNASPSHKLSIALTI